MNAWPMLERCLRNQWLGYTPQERGAIEIAWGEDAAPGLLGGLVSHREYILWEVPSLLPTHRRLLSVKEDYMWKPARYDPAR